VSGFRHLILASRNSGFSAGNAFPPRRQDREQNGSHTVHGCVSRVTFFARARSSSRERLLLTHKKAKTYQEIIMSRMLAALAIAFALSAGFSAAHADDITPHGVWDHHVSGK
jgi:hypothetical protein